MTKDHTKIVRIRKVHKIAPDHRGRSVWLGTVEPVELELVSTTAVEKILKTGGGETAASLTETARRKVDELSLVDTEILRKTMKTETKAGASKASGKKDKQWGHEDVLPTFRQR